MPLVYWREDTIAILEPRLGPAGRALIDQCVSASGIPGWRMTPANYLKFLKALERALPRDREHRELIHRLRRNVFGRIEEGELRLDNWRDRALGILADEIGPAARVVYEDSLRAAGEGVEADRVAGFLRFLDHARTLLPEDIDADAVVLRIKQTIFDNKPKK